VEHVQSCDYAKKYPRLWVELGSPTFELLFPPFTEQIKVATAGQSTTHHAVNTNSAELKWLSDGAVLDCLHGRLASPVAVLGCFAVRRGAQVKIGKFT